MPKMNVNLYVIEDYENEPPSGPKNTPPNTPNFKSEGRSEIMERFTQPIRPILKNYAKEPGTNIR